MRKFLLLCLLCALLMGVNEVKQRQLVSIQTGKGEIHIPYRDRKRLDYFFRELILYSTGGYTLYGTKPVSFESVEKPTFKWNLRHLWHAFFPSNLRRYRSWETWQKYQHHFASRDLLIWSESNPWIDDSELIIIANLPQVKRVLSETRSADSPQSVQSLFSDCLKTNEEFLGILLGYGSDNAHLFIHNDSPSLQPIFSTELDQLFTNKTVLLNYIFGWPHAEIGEVLMYPTFMVDPDSLETQNLRLEYLKVRKQIADHYRGRDFLEATLERLGENGIPNGHLRKR